MRKFLRVAQLGDLEVYRIEVFEPARWCRAAYWRKYSFSESMSKEAACSTCAAWNQAEEEAEARSKMSWHQTHCGGGGSK